MSEDQSPDGCSGTASTRKVLQFEASLDREERIYFHALILAAHCYTKTSALGVASAEFQSQTAQLVDALGLLQATG